MKHVKYFRNVTLGRSELNASVTQHERRIEQYSQCSITGSPQAIEASSPAVATQFSDERLIINQGVQSWKTEADNESFKRVVESGIIKMTPYSVGTQEIIDFPVLQSQISTPYGIFAACAPHKSMFNRDVYGNCGYPPGLSVESPYAIDIAIGQSVVQTWSDFSELGHLPVYGINPTENDEAMQSNRIKADIVGQLSHDFDFLTTVAEFSETAHMVRSILYTLRRPISQMKKLHNSYMRLSKKGRLSKLGQDLLDKWMEYRYGIMPSVYTIVDAIKVINSTGAYRTVRSSSKITYGLNHVPDNFETPYLENTGSISGTIRGTGKSYYSSEALRLSSQIAMNPAVTAWEITKLSFVIDWFVNIGDYITAKSHEYLSTAQNENMCLSIKFDSDINTYLRVPVRKVPFNMGLNGSQRGQHSAITERLEQAGAQDIVHSGGGLVRYSTKSTYDRYLFTPADVKIQLQPHITWQRSLDSLALSFKSISRFYRRI